MELVSWKLYTDCPEQSKQTTHISISKGYLADLKKLIDLWFDAILLRILVLVESKFQNVKAKEQKKLCLVNDYFEMDITVYFL